MKCSIIHDANIFFHIMTPPGSECSFRTLMMGNLYIHFLEWPWKMKVKFCCEICGLPKVLWQLILGVGVIGGCECCRSLLKPFFLLVILFDLWNLNNLKRQNVVLNLTPAFFSLFSHPFSSHYYLKSQHVKITSIGAVR